MKLNFSREEMPIEIAGKLFNTVTVDTLIRCIDDLIFSLSLADIVTIADIKGVFEEKLPAGGMGDSRDIGAGIKLSRIPLLSSADDPENVLADLLLRLLQVSDEENEQREGSFHSHDLSRVGRVFNTIYAGNVNRLLPLAQQTLSSLTVGDLFQLLGLTIDLESESAGEKKRLAYYGRKAQQLQLATMIEIIRMREFPEVEMSAFQDQALKKNWYNIHNPLSSYVDPDLCKRGQHFYFIKRLDVRYFRHILKETFAKASIAHFQKSINEPAAGFGLNLIRIIDVLEPVHENPAAKVLQLTLAMLGISMEDLKESAHVVNRRVGTIIEPTSVTEFIENITLDKFLDLAFDLGVWDPPLDETVAYDELSRFEIWWRKKKNEKLLNVASDLRRSLDSDSLDNALE